jgi:putative tricarboxylic transport membrane protein
VGGRDWVLRQLIGKQTGANWAFIPFPTMADRLGALLGGHTTIQLVDPQEAGEHIRSGTLRVIVQVADSRLPPYPNVPTLKEAGFDVPSMPLFRGVVAPPGIPREAVAYWEDLFARFAKTPSWRKYLEDNVLEDGFQRSAEQSKFFDEYADAMRAIFRDGGIKVVR